MRKRIQGGIREGPKRQSRLPINDLLGWYILSKGLVILMNPLNPDQIIDTILVSFSEVLWSISIPDHRFLYVSPSVKGLLGYESAYLKQNPFPLSQLVFEADHPHLRSVFDGLSSRGFASAQFRMVHQNGTVVGTQTRAAVVYNHGSPVRIDGMTAMTKCATDDAILSMSDQGFLQAMIDLVPDLVYARNRNGQFVVVNQATANWYKTTVEQMIGKTDSDFHFSKEEALRFIHDDQKIFQTKKRSEIQEERISRSDGTTRLMQTTKRFFQSGSEEYVIGVSSDITKVKQFQKSLVRNSQFKSLLLKLASDFINAPIQQLDNAVQSSIQALGELTQTDRVYILDYDFEKGIARNSYEWCAPGVQSYIDHLQSFPLVDMQSWIDQHSWGREVYYPRVDELEEGPIRSTLEKQGIQSLITLPLLGKRCYGSVGLDMVRHPRRLRNEELNLFKLFAQMLVSVYERKELEQEVLEQQQRINSIMDEMPGSVWSISYPDYASIYFSPSSEKLYGRSLEEIQGNPDIEFEFTHPDDLPITKKAFEILERDGKAEFEYRLVRPDHSFVWVNSKMEAIRENGSIIRIHGIDTDITERKTMESKLLEMKKEAEAASKAKSLFLSNMSHELRTPLTGMIGFAETLHETGLTCEQHYLLNHIITASKALQEVVGNVLDIAKIEAGKLDLHPRPTDLNQLCHHIRSLVQFQAGQKSIHIQINVDPSIPKVSVDPLRLQQILLNLVGNAIKFTPDLGTVSVQISRVSSDPLQIRFEVADTGIGISEEDQQRIFLPFEQADGSATRRFGGTGLGLAIASELIQLMGAHMHVHSKPNVGSTFFFTLWLDGG